MSVTTWGWNIGIVRNSDETDWAIVDSATDPADAWDRAQAVRAQYGSEFSVYVNDALGRSAEQHTWRAWAAREGVSPNRPSPPL